MVMQDIIDYQIANIEELKQNKTVSWKYKRFNLILIKQDNIEVETNYIEMTIVTYNETKNNHYEETLHILNSIYKEVSKLKILGLGYPTYKLRIDGYNKIECVLVNFDTSSKESLYTVKKFVTTIDLDKNKCINVDKLELKHPITIVNLGKTERLHIIGIDNIKELNESTLGIISYTVAHHYNGELRLKHLESIVLFKITKVYDITKITFEDTCTITNIPSEIINRFYNLKELNLCKSIKTFKNEPIKEILKQDDKGYYTEVYRPIINRSLKIRFNLSNN
mgnify:CR=1 FL=1